MPGGAGPLAPPGSVPAFVETLLRKTKNYFPKLINTPYFRSI